MQTLTASTERMSRVAWLVWPLVLLALTARLPAQGLRDLVDAALDERITERIEILEQPIRAALHELERPTGQRFVLDELAIEWMPYGEQTRIAIVMEDISVRDGLRRIFDGLGLALRVIDDQVLVEPGPVLDRLGRRLTIDEVALLQKLADKPWSELQPAELKIEYRLPPGADYRQQLERALAEVPPGNALAQLEAATQRQGWLWIPAGQSIVIYSRSEEINQRLERPLDMHYRRVPLDELLVDLGRRLGVTIRFEPGALQRVSARDRHVDLVQRGISTRQALELIAGNTGLWYEVLEDGIIVGATAPEDAAAPAKPRVVAILRIPVGADGTTFDILLREDQVPPEYQELLDRMLERKMPEVFELLRARLDG